MINRTPTGIPGLDELIGGGFPRNSVILLAGTCGAGKTIMSAQFLYTGASQHNEPGIYVTFEEEPESIRQTMETFGWDIRKLEEENKFKFISIDPTLIKGFAEELVVALAEDVSDMGVKRVVFDSITYYALFFRDPYEFRKNLSYLRKRMTRMGCTVIMTSEMPYEKPELGRFTIEEFVADGVIVLYYLRTDHLRHRALEILKMRKSKHSSRLHAFEITDKGVVVHPAEVVFEEGV